MVQTREIVILYTKYPQPGFCKTRLIPELGAWRAAHLQRQMSVRLVTRLNKIIRQRAIDLTIHYDGTSQRQMQQWLGTRHHFHPQGDGDLGDRMIRSIRDQIPTFSRIVLMGSDCPWVDESIINQAFDGLEQHDLVIGPSFDGGYYLIGVRSNLPDRVLNGLFQGIDWSTEFVLFSTLKKTAQFNLSCHTLPYLHDIDTPDDLGHLGYYPNTQ